MKLTETVTVTREVPMHIKDLVMFAKWVAKTPAAARGPAMPMTDEELIAAARDYWESAHGEE
jgi:hypothetical protein